MRWFAFILYLLVILPVIGYVLVNPEPFWSKVLMWILFMAAVPIEMYFNRKEKQK